MSKTKLDRELQEVCNEISEVQQRLNALQERFKELKRQTPLVCDHCQKKSKVCELTYIQDMWYERPYGCTGGDSWHESDEANYTCLHCGKRNRCYSTVTQYNKVERGPRPWVMELKKYFKDVVREYDQR